MKKLNIAICVPFNDIQHVKNKTKKKKTNPRSVRSYLNYYQQFLCLVNSARDNLKSVNYKFYAFNTIPFSEKVNLNLKKMNVEIITVKSDHPYYCRPEIYIHPIDCDYKLVLDCDTLFCNDFSKEDIEYFKKYDFMGMYGHREINYKSYKNILNMLKLKYPNELNQTLYYKDTKRWTNLNTIFYQTNDLKTRLYPYFNNGCIMIKNSLSSQLGILWKRIRIECNKKTEFNKGQCGELTIGLCANHLTDNWNALPKGYNLVCGPSTNIYKDGVIESKYKVKPVIIHYVAVDNKCHIYKKYMEKYFKKYIV